MTSAHDAIVIGTGQSGPALARLAAAGRTVAIVERKRFGGTCVNNGCIPTKSLVASAQAAHVARRAAEFGVVIDGPIRVDMQAVKARKDAIVRVSNQGVEASLRETEGVSVLVGHARFVGSQQVAVGEQVLEAPEIFINVGGRAAIPPLPGIEGVPYLTNSSMMAVDFLPEHLVILGGSYIGLEFGQMYRRFGSEVTIIQRGPQLIPREDEDVSTAIRAILEDEGIRILTNTEIRRIGGRDGEIVVALSAGGEKVEITGSHLLVATGRRPNTDDLGLKPRASRPTRRASSPSTTSCAPACPGFGRWATATAAAPSPTPPTTTSRSSPPPCGDPRRVSERIPTYGLFIDPPLGRAGMTEKEVRRRGIPALVSTMPMEDVGRAYERSETKGFMKILVEARTKQILGAALLGIGGDEIVQGLLDLMYAKAPCTVVQRAMHIHPPVYEMIPVMFEDLRPLA